MRRHVDKVGVRSDCSGLAGGETESGEEKRNLPAIILDLSDTRLQAEVARKEARADKMAKRERILGASAIASIGGFCLGLVAIAPLFGEISGGIVAVSSLVGLLGGGLSSDLFGAVERGMRVDIREMRGAAIAGAVRSVLQQAQDSGWANQGEMVLFKDRLGELRFLQISVADVPCFELGNGGEAVTAAGTAARRISGTLFDVQTDGEGRLTPAPPNETFGNSTYVIEVPAPPALPAPAPMPPLPAFAASPQVPEPVPVAAARPETGKRRSFFGPLPPEPFKSRRPVP